MPIPAVLHRELLPTSTRRARRPTLKEIYDLYGAQVFRRARTLLRDPDRARDATQEVFLRAVQDPGGVRAHPLPWLFRVTKNLCLNNLRDSRRRIQLLAGRGPESGSRRPDRRARRRERAARAGAGLICRRSPSTTTSTIFRTRTSPRSSACRAGRSATGWRRFRRSPTSCCRRKATPDSRSRAKRGYAAVLSRWAALRPEPARVDPEPPHQTVHLHAPLAERARRLGDVAVRRLERLEQPPPLVLLLGTEPALRTRRGARGRSPARRRRPAAARRTSGRPRRAARCASAAARARGR